MGLAGEGAYIAVQANTRERARMAAKRDGIPLWAIIEDAIDAYMNTYPTSRPKPPEGKYLKRGRPKPPTPKAKTSIGSQTVSALKGIKGQLETMEILPPLEEV